MQQAQAAVRSSCHPSAGPALTVTLGRRKSFHVGSPRTTAGMGAAAGACLSWLWPLTQPWPLLECRVGPRPAPPRWPRVRSPPGRSCARSARPPLCTNDMRAARAKSWEQLSSPPAWWAQEELQVWDLAWLLHFVLIYFHVRFSLHSSRGTEIASKQIYSLKNEREKKIKMHFSVTKHTTEGLPEGCPWPTLPWGHGEHEGPGHTCSRAGGSAGSLPTRRPAGPVRPRHRHRAQMSAGQPAPCHALPGCAPAAGCEPLAGPFLVFFLEHPVIGGLSRLPRTRLLSPCHSCNAAFSAL